MILLKMKTWNIPHNYLIWSQRQISQNFCFLIKQRELCQLRSFVINVARSFKGHIFTENTEVGKLKFSSIRNNRIQSFNFWDQTGVRVFTVERTVLGHAGKIRGEFIERSFIKQLSLFFWDYDSNQGRNAGNQAGDDGNAGNQDGNAWNKGGNATNWG